MTESSGYKDSEKQIEGSDFIWLFFLLLAALILRLLFLSSGGDIIDSDEAIVGLMAKHVQEGRSWPIFYYGQHYMGSLEAVLTAAVFEIAGRSIHTLKAVPLMFSLYFVALVYFATKKCANRRAAILATTLAALPPAAFMEWSLKTRGGFIELVVLGTLAYVIALKILRQPTLKYQDSAILGLILGLSWWVNNQAIFYLFTIALVIGPLVICRFGLLPGLTWGAATLVSFAIGGLPFWKANLTGRPKWSTFEELGKGASFPDEVIEHLRGYFLEALPIILGGRRFWTTTDLFPGSMALAYLLFIVLLLSFLAKGDKLTRLMFAVHLVIIPLVFSASSFGWLTQAPRYVLPLYSALFLIYGVGTENLLQVRSYAAKVAGIVLFAALFSVQWASNYLGEMAIPGQPFVSDGERAELDQSQLYRWLLNENYHYVQTNYWIGYRMAFETDEKILFSVVGEPRTTRIPFYEQLKSEVDAPLVLVRNQVDRITESLSELGYSFRITRIGRYFVVDRIIAHDDFAPVKRIPVSSEQIRTSSRQDWARSLVDGDIGTRWGSGVHQQPGMFIELSFPTPVVISRVVIQQGFWKQDAARTIGIHAIDGPRTCSLFEGLIENVSIDTNGSFRLNFPPREVTQLRIEQRGLHPILDWSVAELELFGPDGETSSVEAR